MITPTMTLDEAAVQYRDDLQDILNKRKDFQHRVSSMAKRTRRFPLDVQYEYISHRNRNRYIFFYHVGKRGGWKVPETIAVCIFDRPEGKYAMSSINAGRQYVAFPPHFFSRYRKRILVGEDLHGDGLIKRFFLANRNFSMETVTEEHTKAFRKYESEDGVFLAGRCEEGNVFMEELSPTVTMVKTIIPDTMLFEEQKEAFGRLGELYDTIRDVRIRAFSKK